MHKHNSQTPDTRHPTEQPNTEHPLSGMTDIEKQYFLLDCIENEYKHNLIEEALEFFLKQDPYFITEYTTFKWHFYDHLTLKEISKKKHNVTKSCIRNEIQYAIMLIKFYIKKYHNT